MNVFESPPLITQSRSSWWYWVTRLVPRVELTPIRIALSYATLGLLALYVSDVLFVQYLSDPLLGQVQALKGGAEVVLSAGFIFALTARREGQLGEVAARVERQREELQVLHRVLRHNLRNDLNVVQGRVELLDERLTDQAVREQVETLLDCVDRMTQYTEQAGRINRITDRNGSIRPIELSQRIPAAVNDVVGPASDAQMSVTVPDNAVVEASPMLEEAIAELVQNAIEHNDDQVPSVSVTVDPDAGPAHLVEIRVADDGPGIPPGEVEPLETGTEDQLLHLSGMGLWFVEWTARQSDGELRLDPGEDGTVATIRIPKSPSMLSPAVPAL